MPHFGARLALALAMVIGLLATMTGRSDAQFVLYDDFDTGIIDPEKWAATSGNGTFDAPAAETIRIVESGQLRLLLHSYGATTNDIGGVGAQQGFNMKQLGISGGTGFITGIKAHVTILNAKGKTCSTNPETARPRVQLLGRFFNDGSSTGPTDQTGDIQAYLIILRDGLDRRIDVGLQRCPNSSCSGSTGIGGTQFTTTWAPNVPVMVKLQWEKGAGKFRFVANDEKRDVFYPIGLIEGGPPVVDFKQVGLLNFVQNCTAARKKATIDARIDNIGVRRQP